MTTREKILRFAAKGRPFKVSHLVESLKMSRQTLSFHLAALVKEGLLEKAGSTKMATYTTARGGARVQKKPPNKKLILIRKVKGLKENELYDEVASRMGLERLLRPNVIAIVSYALTEMVNNAIDHSQSSTVRVEAEIGPEKIVFQVLDSGIGIFENIRKKFNLHTEGEALEHLLKGRQTTAPAHHSGEGIFFTSRIADEFSIVSHQTLFRLVNSTNEVFVGEVRRQKGTKVRIQVKIRSRKILNEIFMAYTNDDFEFDKTEVRVRVTGALGAISRSQAKRLLVGLDKFRRIVFDFKEVKEIGQGFVDEVFRIYGQSHPKSELTYVNAVPPVEFMILRAKASLMPLGLSKK